MFLMLAFKLPLRQLNWAITKATEYETFDFSFHILVFFRLQESFNVTGCERYRFFSVLAAVIRKNSDKRACIENRQGFFCSSFINPTEWRERWIAISNTWKNTVFFSRVLLRLEIIFITVYMIISFYAAMNPLSLIKITKITIHQYQYPRI